MKQLSLQHLFMVNEVEIVYRNEIPYQDRIRIIASVTAYEVLRATWDQNRMDLVEQFKGLLLDRRNNCLSVSTIATGGTSSCVADPKLIFATALKATAASLIIAHNHPNSNLMPSEADKSLTHKMPANTLTSPYLITSSSRPAPIVLLPTRG